MCCAASPSSSASPEAGSPFAAAAGGVRVALRVTPRGGADRIDGVRRAADGAALLEVTVRAAPESGKANAAVVALMAKAWRVPKSSLALVAGAASRRKALFVPGDPTELLPRLEAWLSGRQGHDPEAARR